MNKRIHRIPQYAAWFYPRRIWYGEPGSVYLTFDDGPHPEITPWLLEYLREQEVKATLFWNGEHFEKYSYLLDEVRKEGHLVGHHGNKHLSNLKLTFEDFIENYETSKRQLTSSFYRPPYGKIKSRQAKYISKKEQIVMWNWMAYDFDKSLSVKNIIQKAREDIKGGDILVFHENDKTNGRIQEIIPTVITDIKKKGLNFDTIDSIK